MIRRTSMRSRLEAFATWWWDVDDEILKVLDHGHVMTTHEIAQKLGVPESAVASFLAMLALDDKVRIVTVAAAPTPERTSG